jgi:hypothetical protein
MIDVGFGDVIGPMATFPRESEKRLKERKEDKGRRGEREREREREREKEREREREFLQTVIEGEGAPWFGWKNRDLDA